MGKHRIPIPARTRPTECKSCGQTIYFAPHPSTGRMHPISILDDDAIAPSPLLDGIGISHFADCPEADKHRTKR